MPCPLIGRYSLFFIAQEIKSHAPAFFSTKRPSWIDVHTIQLLAEELVEKLSMHFLGIDILEEVGMEPFGEVKLSRN
jgi:hypothetical protein